MINSSKFFKNRFHPSTSFLFPFRHYVQTHHFSTIFLQFRYTFMAHQIHIFLIYLSLARYASCVHMDVPQSISPSMFLQRESSLETIFTFPSPYIQSRAMRLYLQIAEITIWNFPIFPLSPNTPGFPFLRYSCRLILGIQFPLHHCLQFFLQSQSYPIYPIAQQRFSPSSIMPICQKSTNLSQTFSYWMMLPAGNYLNI